MEIKSRPLPAPIPPIASHPIQNKIPFLPKKNKKFHWGPPFLVSLFSISFLLALCLLFATKVSWSFCYSSDVQNFFPPQGICIGRSLCVKSSPGDFGSLLPDCIQVSAHMSPPQRSLSDPPPLFSIPSSCLIFLHTMYCWYYMFV